MVPVHVDDVVEEYPLMSGLWHRNKKCIVLETMHSTADLYYIVYQSAVLILVQVHHCVHTSTSQLYYGF